MATPAEQQFQVTEEKAQTYTFFKIKGAMNSQNTHEVRRKFLDAATKNHVLLDLSSGAATNFATAEYHIGADARLRTPPSINTLTRIHKLCTRARSILASRAVPAATLNMETAHALPAPEEFLVYPTPYFKVRNQWLKQDRKSVV